MLIKKQDVAIGVGSLGSLYILTLLHWSVIPLLICFCLIAWGWFASPDRTNPFSKK